MTERPAVPGPQDDDGRPEDRPPQRSDQRPPRRPDEASGHTSPSTDAPPTDTPSTSTPSTDTPSTDIPSASTPSRLPGPRPAADDTPRPAGLPRPRGPGDTAAANPARGTADEAAPPPDDRPAADHRALRTLLGAWALTACSPAETAAVEAHLTDCATCAEEALRLHDAVALLPPQDGGHRLDPHLRSRTLRRCLARRPPRIPLPAWAVPYDAETARLDALLWDLTAAAWHTPVLLRWYDGTRCRTRATTVTGVLGHLLAVDGTAATALGLPDPLGEVAPTGAGPLARTGARREAGGATLRNPPTVHDRWRTQTRALLHTVSVAEPDAEALSVPGVARPLPLPDAFLQQAFACYVHAHAIADALGRRYDLPAGDHLHPLLDLLVRRLPGELAERRRQGLATGARRVGPAGQTGRALRLRLRGSGGGRWYVPFDPPAALPDQVATGRVVADLTMDVTRFCALASGRLPPSEAAGEQRGDRAAVTEVLRATASLSRL